MNSLASGLTSLLFRHTFQWLRQVGRVLLQLWHEMTGTLFLAMGVLASPAAVREWRAYEHGTGALWRFAVVAVFILCSVSFGIGSFFRSKRLKN